MSKHNNNLQHELEQLIQDNKDLKSKLGTLSGFVITMLDSINREFKELKKQNDKQLHILTRKADIHFYIMIIFAYCSFIISIFFQK